MRIVNAYFFICSFLFEAHLPIMGANTSALGSEEIDEISRQASLSQLEVKRLYKRFQKLDRTQSGTLDTDELLMVPELAMNPLHPRFVSIFENVNFTQFATHMSAFSPASLPEKKVDFAFRMYDIDADGFVSEADLEALLRMLVGDYIPAETLRTVVKRIVADADLDGDGLISRAEFTEAVDVAGLAKKLTVAF